MVDYTAESEFCNKFREGKIDIDSLKVDGDVKIFLHQLAPHESDPPKLSAELTREQMIAGFKIWPEKTSTSPEGRHLGHYKAWIHKETGEKVKDEMTPNSFFDILNRIIQIAIDSGTPLRRWNTVHNIFISKEAGNLKIHRLRVIHKLDAELNLIRREFVTRRAMKNMEKHNLMADEQYGGRNGRSAIDVVMLKTFTIAIFHLMRCNGAIIDCDAKACYDRILPALIALLYYKAGLVLNLCILFARALKQMNYHMVTAYGVSKESNQHSDNDPSYGMGQGAADGPGGWSLVSNVIVKSHNQKAYGSLITDPIKTIKVHRSADSFVDDTTLVVNAPRQNTSAKTIMSRVQHDLASWSKFLWISGGLLELSKTKYYILIWNFSPKGKPLLCEEKYLPQNTVSVHDQHGDLTKIERISETKGLKMLGVRIAGNLQYTTEYNHLHKKTKKFICAIIACPVQPHEIWEAYNIMYLPSVTYSLASTAMEFAQFEALHQLLFPRLLSRLGYISSFPRKILFGPKLFGGIGAKDLEAVQGIAMILVLIKHIRNGSTVGDAGEILIRWAQMMAGTSLPILVDNQDIPHIENKWIRKLREFLRVINAQIKETDPWTIPSAREHDHHIMDAVLKSPTISTSECARINYCRMYLQVTTLSDITTSDGNYIRYDVLMGEGDRTQRIEDIKWPYQEKPNTETWKLWEKTIRSLFCTHGQKLRQPLGQWTDPEITKWKYRYSHKTQALYRYSKSQWHEHQNDKRSRRRILVEESSKPTTLPDDSVPVTDIEELFEGFQFSIPTQASPEAPINETTIETFSDYVRTLPDWEQQLISSTRESTDETESTLNKLLTTAEDLFLVTDGGANDGHGYFGWVIATSSEILWRGKGRVPGNRHLMESLRTESVGMLSLTIFLLHYCNFHDITLQNENMFHYCDNSTVVKRMNWFQDRINSSPNSHLAPDNDVQVQIEATMDKLKTKFPTRWVKGHQKPKDGEELPWEASLNIEADDLANDARDETSANDDTFFQYPASKLMLYINDLPITRNLAKEIQNAWSTQDLREFMMINFGWEKGTADLIDWYSHGSTLLGYDYYRHQFCVKLIHGRLPVLGEKWTASENKICPCCETFQETFTHYMECNLNPHIIDELRDGLKPIFNDHEVDPILRIMICLATTNHDVSMEILEDLHPIIDFEPYTDLIEEQGKIGWNQLLLGRFGLAWDQCQRRYLHTLHGKPATGEPKWIRQIIREAWKYQNERWKARNEQLHGPSNGRKTSEATKEALLIRIKALYQHEFNVLAQDRFPFVIDIADWKNKTATAMKHWLQSNTPYIKQCLKTAKIQHKNNSSDIRKFIKSTTPSNQKEKTQPKRAKTTRRQKSNLPPDHDIRTFIPITRHAARITTRTPTIPTTTTPSSPKPPKARIQRSIKIFTQQNHIDQQNNPN
jgi:hypothetical protein